MHPIPVKGFIKWERDRRRQLRADGVLDYAGSKSLALHERRVRVQIGKIIGNRKAKALQLMACDGGRDSDLWFGFVVVDQIDGETWRKLQNIEGLFRPLERD